jgi:hypothetical protein
MTEDSSTPRAGPGRWTQRAGFSVLFDVAVGPTNELWRTRIYHDESGQETELIGKIAARWPRWMLDRLESSGQAAPGERVATGPTSVAHEVAVEIVDLRILSRTPEPDHIERVRIQADLRISGLAELERRLGAAVLERALSDVRQRIDG